jgi:FkbM family methyltransferase
MTAEKVLTIASEFGELRFAYPDSGNMDAHVRAILKGETYPWPATPEGYVYDTIVDVGANIGAASLWFAARKPRRLICFEPSKGNFALLRRNLAAVPGTEFLHYGLLDRDAEMPLYHGASQPMQHSLVRSIETGQDSEAARLRRASVAFAELKIERISLLKLDTEGSEVPILRDIAPMFPRVDMFYVEYHSESDRRDIDGLMSAGYVLIHATARHAHRGVNLYMADRLANAVPLHAAMALSRPA